MEAVLSNLSAEYTSFTGFGIAVPEYGFYTIPRAYFGTIQEVTKIILDVVFILIGRGVYTYQTDIIEIGS